MMDGQNIKYLHLCCGPDDEAAKRHQERSEYHDMMAKFYRLSQKKQLAFMAYFDSLAEGDDD